MGLTSSTEKNKKPELPNEAVPNTEADDSDDEGAHAARQPITESIASEPKNPLKIAEISNLVAEHVPENSKSILASTSTLFHAATQGHRIAHKCALLTSRGEEEKVKQLFNLSPDNIGYMIAEVDFEDFSERKIHCSAIQYAIWAGDWHMWDMMLKALDEAEKKAIPKDEWDKITAEARRHKPYLGSITKEEIVAIRAELFEQYKAVVDNGLDYTITRYDRVQDANEECQLINPRIVEVRGETHFDLKGTEFCLMLCAEQFPLEKNKLYVRIEDGTLHYQVIALFGEKVNGTIALADIQCPLVQLDNTDQLTPYIHKILKITAERDHTHPQALISALESYDYGLNHNNGQNNWSYFQLKEQWCGGVGMAEREVPAVIAQEMCRQDVLLHVNRGPFKEPNFKRFIKYYNYQTDGFEPWFVADGNLTKLGMYFGIVNWQLFSARYGAGKVQGAADAANTEYLRNLEALSALSAVRIIDRASLRDELDPKNRQEELAVGQGFAMA